MTFLLSTFELFRRSMSASSWMELGGFGGFQFFFFGCCRSTNKQERRLLLKVNIKSENGEKKALKRSYVRGQDHQVTPAGVGAYHGWIVAFLLQLPSLVSAFSAFSLFQISRWKPIKSQPTLNSSLTATNTGATLGGVSIRHEVISARAVP